MTSSLLRVLWLAVKKATKEAIWWLFQRVPHVKNMHEVKQMFPC